MNADPELGTQIVVVQRSAPPRQWQAETIVCRDATLSVRVQGSPGTWDPFLQYSIIWGATGSRVACQATFMARKDDVAAFRLTSAWRLIDLRRAARFELALSAEVRSVLGSSRQPGRLVDISATGAAVEVATRPGGSQVEIGLRVNGYSARLLCEVVRARPADDQTILHLRFRDLTPPQQAFVRQVVGHLIESQAS